MAQLYSNNGVSSLNGGITNVATTVNLTATEGALFQAPTGGDFELITVFDGATIGASTNVEIMKVTARTGDALTVVRGQEGTAGFAFSDAAGVEATATAGSFSDLAKGRAGLLQGVTEVVHTAATIDIAPANGNVQVRTLAGNETLTFSNIAVGQSVVLKVVPGANTLTLTNVAKWTNGGTAPSAIAAEHWLVITNIDGTIVGTDVGGVS
jgi:allophanate hydrolase subunit 2